MTFNLASKSRRYFGVIVLLTALATGAGIYAVLQMPNSVYPEVAFPRIVVIAELPGTSIDMMEVSVTRPLETAISTVTGVERVQSTTIRGSSELSVIFAGDADMQAALVNVRGRIATMSADLPKETSLVIEQQTPSVFPIITLDLSGGASPAALKDFATYTLRPLVKVHDVANVTILGGDEREIVVEPDPAALANAGLSLDEFCQQLQAGNSSQAAGKIDWNHQALGILSQSISNTPAQVAHQVIVAKSGAKLRVEDLARVRLWHEDRTQAVSGMNRQRQSAPVVSVSIFRKLGGNTLAVASALEQELKKLRPQLPANIEMHIVYNQAQFVRESVANVRDAILIGGLGSVLVLLLFLRSVRATLISAVTIPVTIAITFLFLRRFNQSLNLMSMGGLAVAIGLIIDDTVVVIENICRHLAHRMPNVAQAVVSRSPDRDTTATEGLPKPQETLSHQVSHGQETSHKGGPTPESDTAAVVDAASREITGAVVGSTLTTVMVFVPLAFISGMVGQFFTSLSMALCTAVLVSMVLSLTLIPVAAARILKPGSIPAPGRIFNSFAYLYERALRLALHWRKTALAAALAVIPLMWLLYGRLESGLLPNMDEGTFILDYFLPEGTSLAETDQMASKIEDILKDNEYVAAYTRRTGAENGFFATQMFRGDFTVVLVDRGKRPPIDEIMGDIRGEIRRRYPAIQRVEPVQVMQDELNDLAGATKRVEIKIFGPDDKELRRLAKQAGEILDSKEVRAAGLEDVDDKVHEGNADVYFRIDPVQAAAVGLTASQIQDQVRTALFGQVTNTVKQGERLINIRVRLSDALRSNLDRLANLSLATPSGKTVPLGQVVTFSRRRTPVEVWRKIRSRGSTSRAILKMPTSSAPSSRRFSQSSPSSSRLYTMENTKDIGLNWRGNMKARCNRSTA